VSRRRIIVGKLRHIEFATLKWGGGGSTCGVEVSRLPINVFAFTEINVPAAAGLAAGDADRVMDVARGGDARRAYGVLFDAVCMEWSDFNCHCVYIFINHACR
jgi:hypothetical protein